AFVIYQFRNSMEGLADAIKENAERKEKRKKDALTYGDHIEEISPKTYEKYRLKRTRHSNLDTSKIRKSKGSIQVQLKIGTLTFQDHFEENCMACVIEHEAMGTIPQLQIAIIETSYYRSRICQVINLQSGRIDTLTSTPTISPNYTLAIIENDISKDTLTKGLNLYAIEEGRFRFTRQIGDKWTPIEYFWKDSLELYAKVYLVEDNQILYDEEKCIRIKKKNTEAKSW
ncbi:MAG: hypothetical protein AAF598_18480, partial [Bacteroidota bacterium]